jgi:electron transfer flavoprotein alpha subunit
MPLVVTEHAGGEPLETSLQAVALARSLDGDVHALVVGDGSVGTAAASLGAHGVQVVHLAKDARLGAFAPDAWARVTVDLAGALGETTIVAAGTDRGNEVLARIAARLDVPFAANVVSAAAEGGGLALTRVRWGGSLLEDARLSAPVAVLSVQPHAVTVDPPGGGSAETREVEVALADADLVVRVVDEVGAGGGGVSLIDAKVVVSAGRGIGSSEGFSIVEDLAGLLGGAVGCSRAVTIAGWRPHTDQVGQTGTKISPDVYLACGISGATQHMAGCKGAKVIVAVNIDRDAPIFATADYGVVGDLHEVVPAIAAELRRVRGA